MKSGATAAPRVRAVHVFDTPGTNESRFLKEATSTLLAGVVDEVLLLCRWEQGLPDQETVREGLTIRRPRRKLSSLPRNKFIGLLKMWETFRVFRRETLASRPSIIHCHSLVPLRACAAVKRAAGCPLLYDPHELETETNGVKGIHRIVNRILERRYYGSADAVICVSDSIADWYAEAYGRGRPGVVRNIPDVRSQAGVGSTRILRERFKIADSDFLFIYQGGLFRGRRIEQLIRTFARVRPDRHLVFMGYGEMEGEVRMAADRHPNIHFHPAVPPGEVLKHTSSADVGLTGVANVCLSYYFSLPNKLFEYLAAGIPFLVPDYPEMTRIVTEHRCGWVVGENDEDWIARVNELTRPEVESGKDSARRAAPAYSWSREKSVLLDTYRRLLS